MGAVLTDAPTEGGDAALLRVNPDLYGRLLARARGLSPRYYGAPVYLIGSAVTSDDPRDIDVLVVLPGDLFVACYGDPGDTLDTFRRSLGEMVVPPIYRRWARDCATQGARLTLDLKRAVDFKVTHDRDTRILDDLPRVTLCHVSGGVW